MGQFPYHFQCPGFLAFATICSPDGSWTFISGGPHPIRVFIYSMTSFRSFPGFQKIVPITPRMEMLFPQTWFPNSVFPSMKKCYFSPPKIMYV